MDGEISKPFLFSIKKWSVIILCALNIILMIIYASISNLLANRYLYDYEIDRDYRIEEVKLTVIITLLMISIFSISFSILGIIGAVRESFTFTLVFTILAVINFAATLANSIKRPYYIACAIWAILMVIAAVFLTRDLQICNRRKRNRIYQN
ncbi:uncharacterized protein LOC124496098 isoform X2 [Dermatophagoides farinae]|uniref:Uncharacterized protein n=1 Tax=Dermatophagoides farinae TaxID=6954 RepID=A0A922I5M7_DERFA|nr:uncharacterized protein LOC124496098 [Dermatophagoides farinae]KAH7640320.1 hypothetical protein HUG17_7787 [Dermatophagoides farinae]KAH9521175.1 hypothetical protein DERF_004848 [Dermatophagoides farinae]